jgi:PD-(D/E)XK nuclease superfamily protein
LDRPSRRTRESQRAINRRQQGDLGEAAAIEWFTRLGATTFIPFGHSPDVDLVIELEGRLLRIQVKTSTQFIETPDGHQRRVVSLKTCGGNQSWNGVAKEIDPTHVDFLFVLTGDGRRWLIPSDRLDARTSIQLGGPKYSEYEIDPAARIDHLVYGDRSSLNSIPALGEYPRGQRTAAVNRQALPSQVRLLPPPLPRRGSRFKPTRYDRKLGQSGQTTINEKRKVTIPQRAVLEAGLGAGDRLRAQSHGYGRILLERIGLYEDPQPASERTTPPIAERRR